jgi:hypothetical protein
MPETGDREFLGSVAIGGDSGQVNRFGQLLQMKSAHALIDLSSPSAPGLIPAGAIPVGVTARVTTTITGVTGWDLGTSADPDRWGAALALPVDTTSDGADWTDPAVEMFTAATDVEIAPVGGAFTAGFVRVIVHYLQATPPTS